MARPALVIGLGGTGQWVLTYLKKDLIETNQGKMPDNVKLLCFDTVQQITAETAASVSNEDKEVKVGSVRLIPKVEFIHLGGDVHQLSKIVAKDFETKEESKKELPHIGSWFRASEWLADLPTAQFRLSAGAGQLRQFGRVALFNDLRSAKKSEVWRRLDVSIGELSKNLQEKERLEIIVVGSFAGGTGSGLFIDMALLARHRAGRVPFLLRGYFVLPRAFDPNPDDDMLARTFAAWRELNRFMVVNQDFALPNLRYSTADKALQINKITTRCFDACYLVDGVRDGVNIAAETELGVHPTVADAISAILDDEAGRAYTEYAENLAPDYLENRGIPLYSIIGTHTFKVPAYYAQQDFSNKLTKNWLDTLLVPVYDDTDSNKIVRVSNASPHDPTVTGREEALQLLTHPRSHDNATEAPTLFYNRIANIVGEGASDNPAIVEQYARGHLGGTPFIGDFTNLGDRHDMTELISRIKAAARLNIEHVIKTSKEIKEKTKDFPRRVENNIGQFIRQNYGFRTAKGEEDRGSFGRLLDESGAAQLSIFRRLVNYWLMDALMSGDKSGRLGYAYDLLEGIDDHFDDFLEFMEKVKDRRQKTYQPYLKAQEARQRAWQTVLKYANTKLLAIVDHPRAHSSQTQYLKAEQTVINTRKDELLHISITNTVRGMKSYCEEVRHEVARWIQILATGDPVTGVTSLMSALDSHRRSVEQTRQADEMLVAVQTRMGDIEYPLQEDSPEVRNLIQAVSWQMKDTENKGFELELSVEPHEYSRINLERLSGAKQAADTKSLTQRNLNRIQNYAIKHFSDLTSDTRVAKTIHEEFETAQNFVSELGDKAEPLFEQHQGAQGGPAKWSHLIRIREEDLDEDTLRFFRGTLDENKNVLENGVVQILREREGLQPNQRNLDQLIDLVGSADQHKCTMVRTDDLMQVGLFASWHDCQEAYLNNSQIPPKLNQNFPAEANASEYELKLATKRRQLYRVFHPWVVMLLEYPDRLEQFFLCQAFEWISIRDAGAESWYELEIPGFDRAFQLTPRDKTLWSTFQAARYFVLEGLEQKSDSVWMLDYGKIKTSLDNEILQRGDGWLDFLKEQVTKYDGLENVPQRVVPQWLSFHIQELEAMSDRGTKLPKGEPADFTTAYSDLADVALLMMEDLKESKEVQLGRKEG